MWPWFRDHIPGTTKFSIKFDQLGHVRRVKVIANSDDDAERLVTLIIDYNAAVSRTLLRVEEDDDDDTRYDEDYDDD